MALKLLCYSGNVVLDQVVYLLTGYSKLERVLSGHSLSQLLITGSVVVTGVPEPTIAIIYRVQWLLQEYYRVRVHDGETSIESRAKEICSRLKIKDQFHKALKYALGEIEYKCVCVKKILGVRDEAFRPDKHVELLKDIYIHLTHQPKAPSLEADDEGNGAKWDDIGFHNDPSRDIRGVGELGLCNLHFFCTKHNRRAREVLHDAHQPNTFFPFAITGLNITMWLCDWLEEGVVDTFFYQNRNDPVDVLGEIFRYMSCVTWGESSYVFLEFSRFWHLSRPKDLMQFGTVSQQFKIKILKQLKAIWDDETHSEWGFRASTGQELEEELSMWIDGEIHSHTVPQYHA